MSPCRGEDRRFESGRARFHALPILSGFCPERRIPKKMWKKFLKKMQDSESYASMALGLLVVILIAVALVNIFQKKTAKPGQEKISEEAASETQPVALPTTHTVIEGENLWVIAEKYFHSGYNWINIAQENKLANPNLIFVGQTLSIPNVSPILSLTGIDATEIPEQYTVQSGDNLWNISCNLYNNCYRWVDIAKANNLVNPDLIHPGNLFIVPK